MRTKIDRKEAQKAKKRNGGEDTMGEKRTG